MATETVVIRTQPALTQAMIDAGRELVRQARERITITAAFWYYLEDRNRWRLHLASPLVSEKGSTATYGQLLIVLAEQPDRRPYGQNDLEMDDVTVVEPTSELVRLWRTVYPKGVQDGEVRNSGSGARGRYLDSAYFYLL